MLRSARREPVEVVVVHGIDEELAAAAVGLAGIGHRQGARLVRDLRVFGVLVLDRAVRAVAGAGARAVRVGAVRAAELDHEVRDHPVKVQAVVEAGLREIAEVPGGDRHLVREELGRDRAERRFEGRGGVCHAG